MSTSAPESSTPAALPASQKILLWDWPIRIFHWSLVAAVALAVVSVKIGGNWMVWHGRAGLLVLALLVFRLLWGVLGTPYARFAQFAPTPGRVLAYLRGQWQGIGHSPLGALAVFALLGLLALQVASGLFANDDIDFTGPWFHFVSQESSNWLTRWHHRIGDALLWLIGLHVLAIGFFQVVKKQNLLKPMLTGWYRGPAPDGLPASQPGSKLILVLGCLLAILAVWLVLHFSA